MCDWEEAEFAEYLLWVEAAQVTAQEERVTVPRRKSRSDGLPVAPPLTAVEA